MNIYLYFIIILLVSSDTYSQSEVKIGNQIWMSKNLDVSTFRNGETITQAMNMNDWRKASQNKKAAWCYYDFDSKNGQKYGKLYNWYAVSDERGLAPEGYHVPSDQEWNQLLNYESIGGQNTAGRFLKSKTGWTVKTKNKKENNGGGIDKYGFNALPGGGIVSTNTGSEFIFEGYGFIGIWWSTTLDSASYTGDSLIFTKHMYNHNEVQSFSHSKYDGFSVICIKDSDLYIPTLQSNQYYFIRDVAGKKIQVADNDLKNEMTWNEALTACKILGEGWRLPTISELNEIFGFIGYKGWGNFRMGDGQYWSSTIKKHSKFPKKNMIWIHSTYNGGSSQHGEWGTAFVRPVRDLPSSNIVTYDNLKIGDYYQGGIVA